MSENVVCNDCAKFDCEIRGDNKPMPCKDYIKRVPLFKTVDEARLLIEDRIGLLNRMIRQHPYNTCWLSWVNMKEYFEKELLGYSVTWET